MWDVTFTISQREYTTKFLLTHPVWDVTLKQRVFLDSLGISTHTSRVGCDYPQLLIVLFFYISTHTSRVGCDTILCAIRYDSLISTHTSRVGCDLHPEEH